MKKRLLIMLLAILMLMQVCACQSSAQEKDAGKTNESAATEKSPKKPLILIDSLILQTDNEVMRYTQYLNAGYTAQFKCLSSDPEKREMELSSIRAEIMAGGGPDAFVLPCYMQNIMLRGGTTQKETLFLDIEKAMQSKIFLPLDDLIAESGSINMEEHWEVIMEAGRTEEGQVVLPLSFYIPAYFVDSSRVKNPDAEYSSWNGLLNCNDSYALSILRSHSLSWYGTQYAQLADYESENVLITPEEVKEDLIAVSNIAPASAEDAQGVMEVCDYWNLAEWMLNPEAYSVVPVMNDKGGLTACINAFAAINRNSELAEEAFKYIETMFREEVQNNKGILTGDPMQGGLSFGGFARPDGLHIADGAIGISTGKTAYPEAETEVLSGLIEKINAVRFCSKLDSALAGYSELAVMDSGKDETYFEELAEDVCDEMAMILAE